MMPSRAGKTPARISRPVPPRSREATGKRMSTLVLELRQGDVMIVNGAPIRFRTKSRVELTARARFLFGKQIMFPDEADSPARRIYFALQSAYIGNEEERAGGLLSARALIAEFDAATTSAMAREILGKALAAAETDDCYQALKLARRIIKHEDIVLGRAAGGNLLEGSGSTPCTP